MWVDEFCDLHVRVLGQGLADALQVAALFRQALGQKQHLIAGESPAAADELLVLRGKIVGVPLPWAVVVAAQAVDGLVGLFDGFFEVFSFGKPRPGDQEWQGDGAAGECDHISSSGLFRAGEEFPLHRK